MPFMLFENQCLEWNCIFYISPRSYLDLRYDYNLVSLPSLSLLQTCSNTFSFHLLCTCTMRSTFMAPLKPKICVSTRSPGWDLFNINIPKWTVCREHNLTVLGTAKSKEEKKTDGDNLTLSIATLILLFRSYLNIQTIFILGST